MVRIAAKQVDGKVRASGRAPRVRRPGLLFGSDLGSGAAGRRTPAASRAGFTLIELTVAIAILLIGALASFATQVMSGQIIDSSEEVTIIMADMEMCLEEMLLQSADDMPVLYPEGVEVPSYTGLHVRNEDIVPRYLNWNAGDPIPELLEIELVATWLDGAGRVQRQSVVTAKSR